MIAISFFHYFLQKKDFIPEGRPAFLIPLPRFLRTPRDAAENCRDAGTQL